MNAVRLRQTAKSKSVGDIWRNIGPSIGRAQRVAESASVLIEHAPSRPGREPNRALERVIGGVSQPRGPA
jgi:hypothetical protein